MRAAYICDSCGEADQYGMPWDCPGCGEETCENCFDRFAHCRKCSAGKSDEELRVFANDNGWDFETDPSDEECNGNLRFNV
jgi:hypothetical protein